MKKTRISVPWHDGLHLRRATEVVKRAMGFQSSIRLKANQQIADARSVLSLLLLCATLGTVVEVEASGTDEDQALAAITAVFGLDDAETGGESDPRIDRS